MAREELEGVILRFSSRNSASVHLYSASAIGVPLSLPRTLIAYTRSRSCDVRLPSVSACMSEPSPADNVLARSSLKPMCALRRRMSLGWFGACSWNSHAFF